MVCNMPVTVIMSTSTYKGRKNWPREIKLDALGKQTLHLIKCRILSGAGGRLVMCSWWGREFIGDWVVWDPERESPSICGNSSMFVFLTDCNVDGIDEEAVKLETRSFMQKLSCTHPRSLSMLHSPLSTHNKTIFIQLPRN